MVSRYSPQVLTAFHYNCEVCLFTEVLFSLLFNQFIRFYKIVLANALTCPTILLHAQSGKAWECMGRWEQEETGLMQNSLTATLIYSNGFMFRIIWLVITSENLPQYP